MSDTTKTTETTPSTADQRRRSSGAGAFANLMNQKRGSTDEASQARRQSIQDQMPKSGFFGSMWNSWARGHDNSTTSSTAKKPSIHRTGAGTLG